MKRFLTGMIVFSFFHISVFSQTGVMTIYEAFKLAEERSLDALVAKNMLLTAHWQYRNYKAILLPNVVLEGTLPSLNRSLNPYLKKDGSYGFVKNNSLTENVSFSVTQNIPFSGGSVSMQSQLQRIDQLGEGKTGYLSIPFSFTLQQPLFNNAKTLQWAMRIEPEKYEEAQQQFQVDMENVYMKVINYYFDLLLAKINLDIAETNNTNAFKLYEIAQGKRALGLISQNELLQLELGKTNAEASVISAKQAFDNRMLTFRNFLRLDGNETVQPIIPSGFYRSGINLPQVMELANRNNPLHYSMKRRILESRMKIDQAKANRGFKADAFVSFGFTGSDLTLPASYQNLQNREIMSLGVRIPILDWGRGKGGVKLAESELEVVNSQVEQAKLNFEQNIVQSVVQFQDQAKLVNLAHHADSIAQLRYETAFSTFVMERINVLDINAAQVERDNAKRKYINELYLSWLYYYLLRQITLFDFDNNSDINHQTEKF